MRTRTSLYAIGIALIALIALIAGMPARAVTVKADFRVPIQTIDVLPGMNEVDRANYFAGTAGGFTDNSVILQNHRDIGTKLVRIWADTTSWGVLDARVNAIRAIGAVPLMCLEGYSGSNLQAYGDQCVAIVNHYNALYDISQWRWEILNEPNNNSRMSLSTYLNVYNTVEPQLRAAYANAIVGGPSTAGLALDWQLGLMQSAPAGGLQFLTWHRYGCWAEPNAVSDSDLMLGTHDYETDLDQLAAKVAQYRPGTPMILGELNMNSWAGVYQGSWNTDPRVKSIFNAPWYASAFRHVLRTPVGNKVASEMFWEGTGDDVPGGSVGFGMWYAQQPAVRGAVYFAKTLLNKAVSGGAEQVSCDEGGSANLEAFATRAPGKLYLVLINKTTASTSVEARIAGANISSATWTTIDQVAFTASACRVESAPNSSTQSITLNGYSVALLTINGSADGSQSSPPAAPSNIRVQNPGTGSRLNLSWVNPTDSDFDHIHIYRSADPDAIGPKIADDLAGTSYSDTNVANGTTYYYVVRAVDQSGNESANSTCVSGKPTTTGGLSIQSVTTPTVTLIRGETHIITMSVKNNSSSPVRVPTAHLVFTQGGTDISGHFTATPTASPTTINAGAQASYVYSVVVSPSCPIGAVRVDGAVTAYTTSANLVQNDSFETVSSGRPTQWTTWSGVNTFTGTADSMTKIDGTYSYRTTITNSDNPGDCLSTSAQANCASNAGYILGTHWKTGGNGNVWKAIIVNEYDAGGGSVASMWTYLDHVTNWNKATANLTTHGNTAKMTVELRLMPRSAGQTENVWWDSVYLLQSGDLLEDDEATTPLDIFVAGTMSPTWSYTTGGAVKSGVTIYDGVAYAGSDDGYLYAIKATGTGAGTLLWRTPVHSPIRSRAVKCDDLLFFTSIDGFLHAISMTTHQEDPNYPFPQGGAGLASTPAPWNGSLYLTSNYGFMTRINPTTAEPFADTASITSRPIDSSPSIPRVDFVWVVDSDGVVWRFSSDLSVVRWSKALGSSPGMCSPTVIGNRLYLGTSARQIWCLDSGYAGQVWAPATVTGAVRQTIWVDSTGLYVGIADGNLVGLSTETGQPLPGFPAKLSGSDFISTPAGVQRVETGSNRWIYLGSQANRFFAIRADDPTQRYAYRGAQPFASSPSISGNTADDVAVIGSDDGKIYAFSLK